MYGSSSEKGPMQHRQKCFQPLKSMWRLLGHVCSKLTGYQLASTYHFPCLENFSCMLYSWWVSKENISKVWQAVLLLCDVAQNFISFLSLHHLDLLQFFAGRPIHGSLVITQTIKVPQVYLPDMEEVVLPEVAKRFLHRWIPFGAGRTLDIT